MAGQLIPFLRSHLANNPIFYSTTILNFEFHCQRHTAFLIVCGRTCLKGFAVVGITYNAACGGFRLFFILIKRRNPPAHTVKGFSRPLRYFVVTTKYLIRFTPAQHPAPLQLPAVKIPPPFFGRLKFPDFNSSLLASSL